MQVKEERRLFPLPASSYLFIFSDDGELRHWEVKRQGQTGGLVVTGHNFKVQLKFGNVGIFDEAEFFRKTNPSVKGHSLNKFA